MNDRRTSRANVARILRIALLALTLALVWGCGSSSTSSNQTDGSTQQDGSGTSDSSTDTTGALDTTKDTGGEADTSGVDAQADSGNEDQLGDTPGAGEDGLVNDLGADQSAALEDLSADTGADVMGADLSGVDLSTDDASATPDGDDASVQPDGDDASVTPDGDDASVTPDVDDTSVTPDGDDASVAPDATVDAGIPSLLIELKGKSDISSWKSSCGTNCATMLWLPVEVANAKEAEIAIRNFVAKTVKVKPNDVQVAGASCGDGQTSSCDAYYNKLLEKIDPCYAPLLAPTVDAIATNASSVFVSSYTPTDGNNPLPGIVVHAIAGIYEGRAMALLFFTGVTGCKVLDLDALKVSIDEAPTAAPESKNCELQSSPNSCVEMLWPLQPASNATERDGVLEKFLSGKPGVKSVALDAEFACPGTVCANAFDLHVTQFDGCMSDNLRGMAHFLDDLLADASMRQYSLTLSEGKVTAVTFSGRFNGQVVSIVVYNDPNFCQ